MTAGHVAYLSAGLFRDEGREGGRGTGSESTTQESTQGQGAGPRGSRGRDREGQGAGPRGSGGSTDRRRSWKRDRKRVEMLRRGLRNGRSDPWRVRRSVSKRSAEVKGQSQNALRRSRVTVLSDNNVISWDHGL